MTGVLARVKSERHVGRTPIAGGEPQEARRGKRKVCFTAFESSTALPSPGIWTTNDPPELGDNPVCCFQPPSLWNTPHIPKNVISVSFMYIYIFILRPCLKSFTSFHCIYNKTQTPHHCLWSSVWPGSPPLATSNNSLLLTICFTHSSLFCKYTKTVSTSRHLHMCLFSSMHFPRSLYDFVIIQVSTQMTRRLVSGRLGCRGPVFLNDYISKGWLPDPWERHSWIVEDIISRRQRKDLWLHIF